ncbi:hypothetical protein HBH98_212360 [Parastagonospora nodorum]|nr:hypothetical protein HBI13_203800 [Parastagonospora nodorum]KAH4115584.1 hypothetical protein HBH47_179220 [Parastagonospora nodorum]KAH4157274.1 hypothetical protein HBH43_200240 [Parastagonospora nodorum]KAH4216659.1 hypothetical protein HBI06_227790 [Parastagonospora nodorum]KAH4225602.1 hypothetical protein HBI05_226420 [Parastagonospora nodorum]
MSYFPVAFIHVWQKMIPNKGGERKDCDPSQVNFANAALLETKRIRHIALRVSDFQIPRPDVDVERIRRRWSGWARARR